MKRFLRLTGGSDIRKRLYVPNRGVRPATNLIREAIFSTLLSFFEEGVRNLRVLDLYAGSGSLGLEALSRGAREVTFVDLGRESIKTIKKNLDILHFNARVIRSDVIGFLKRNKALPFDLVFLDPPYRYRRSEEVIKLLKAVLDGGGFKVLVFERFFEEEAPVFGGDIELLKRKKYGQTEVLYYRI